jgi:hypothetical protein
MVEVGITEGFRLFQGGQRVPDTFLVNCFILMQYLSYRSY